MKYYSTVTSKGQITLPVSIRKDLNLKPGQKVSITRGEKGKINIEKPPVTEDIRSQLKANLKKQGFTEAKLRTMAESYKNGDGFELYVKEKYGSNS